MSVAFIYPGQGSQFVNMGRNFYNNFSQAKQVFDEVSEGIGKSISNIIFDSSEEELKKTENTQPALMAVSVAIQKVIEYTTGKSIEQLANFLAGHSLGEYSALCTAGSITTLDTAKLLKVRGQSMEEASINNPGSMVAILSAEYDLVVEVVEYAQKFGICQIANDNSTGQIVISGEVEALEKAIEYGKSKSIKRMVKLPVSGAFHSNLMKTAVGKLHALLVNIDVRLPQVQVISNVLCRNYKSVTEIKDSLLQQITNVVRWRETLLYFQDQGVKTIYEIGAGRVLSGLVKKTTPDIVVTNISEVSDLDKLLTK